MLVFTTRVLEHGAIHVRVLEREEGAWPCGSCRGQGRVLNSKRGSPHRMDPCSHCTPPEVYGAWLDATTGANADAKGTGLQMRRDTVRGGFTATQADWDVLMHGEGQLAGYVEEEPA